MLQGIAAILWKCVRAFWIGATCTGITTIVVLQECCGNAAAIEMLQQHCDNIVAMGDIAVMSFGIAAISPFFLDAKYE